MCWYHPDEALATSRPPWPQSSDRSLRGPAQGGEEGNEEDRDGAH